MRSCTSSWAATHAGGFGTGTTRGPDLQVRRARPADRPAAEQCTAQVCATAARPPDDPLRRRRQRCVGRREHSRLVQHLERATLTRQVELVARSALEGVARVGTDLGLHVKRAHEPDGPAGDRGLGQVEMDGELAVAAKVEAAGGVEEPRRAPRAGRSASAAPLRRAHGGRLQRAAWPTRSPYNRLMSVGSTELIKERRRRLCRRRERVMSVGSTELVGERRRRLCGAGGVRSSPRDLPAAAAGQRADQELRARVRPSARSSASGSPRWSGERLEVPCRDRRRGGAHRRHRPGGDAPPTRITCSPTLHQGGDRRGRAARSRPRPRPGTTGRARRGRTAPPFSSACWRSCWPVRFDSA